MVTTDPQTETDSTRRRDAVRTREALLQAAKDLFGAKGYAGTTLRQIGERAGVDPALVARYFGSKTAIYIASLDTEGPDTTAAAPLTPEFIDRMIGRITSVGASPLQQAVVLPTSDNEVRDAARRIIDERIIQPLLQEMERSGLDRPSLRAEIAFAALTGIVLARSAGTFETLAEADRDDVVELTLRTVRAILDD
ncbi:MAG: TetR family transcriptional regulator [Actinomycetota bacterium]|nr:TetR family transcriptional regulator [Actinomycetota bacterium]